jgi:hypothetical protein
MDIFEQRLRNLIGQYERLVEKILLQADKEIAGRITKHKAKYPGSYSEGLFYSRNRQLEREIDEILGAVQQKIETGITKCSESSWKLANEKSDAIVNDFTEGYALSGTLKASFHQLNLEAMTSFLQRAVQGMNLSERIWRLTKIKKYMLEKYLASGLSVGKSAAAISRDIRRFEINPNMLFRRVRNADGDLKLSKSALAYNPGQGVYRSSYKNAMRLTRTEINMAFRTAEFHRRKQLPFVTGIRVELSASHPRHDICDAMEGEYPPDFLFIGWHPQCLCFTTAIMLPKDEFVKYLDSGNVPAERYVSSIPEKAKNYIEDNKGRFLKMKNLPYFLRENRKFIEV